MKALVHIGVEKTGTTAIQRFFQANRARLLKDGWYYPSSPGPANHRKVAAFCVEGSKQDDFFINAKLHGSEAIERWKLDFASNFRREIRSLSDIHTVIISSEHLSSRLTSIGEIEQLKILLDDLFTQVHIFVYLRRQDRVAMSLRGTALRAGNIPNQGFPNLSKIPLRYDYEALLHRWSAVFGREQIKPLLFESALQNGGDIVSDFLAKVGLGAVQDLATNFRVNEAVRWPALELGVLVNKYLPARKDGAVSPWNHSRINVIDHLAAVSVQDPSLPSRNAAEKFVETFAEQNQRVGEEWFGGELFDTDFSKYPEEFVSKNLTANEYEILISELCSRIKELS